MLVILLFIIILNIVSIALMYHCLGDTPKKEKLIFIAAGIAIMYVLTSIVYWISTRNIEVTEVSETGKDLITFLFVPINGILILPIFAKSYYKYKEGSLDEKVLRGRGIVLAVVLLIILIIECAYFENIQEQVVNMLIGQQNVVQEDETEQTEDTENINQTSDEIVEDDEVKEETNDVTDNTEENIVEEVNEVSDVNSVNE